MEAGVVTYPPELLPICEDGDADVFICTKPGVCEGGPCEFCRKIGPLTPAPFKLGGSMESTEVPFLKWGNRQVLTAQQLVEMPWLADFVRRFPRCFGREPNMDVVVFYPDGDAP
jgi:hypothetical protein